MLESLLSRIEKCRICEEKLPLGPRPVVTAHPNSRIAIIGQAPGIRVHESGKPFDDASGRNLREWLQVTEEQFYNPELFAIVPMGFCYPGTGKSGDLPPRPECAREWHAPVFDQLPRLQIKLLVGQFAQKYYLKKLRKRNLTETVRAFGSFLPEYFPLPHPSPRNNIWQKKNPWFRELVLPGLREKIDEILK